MVLENNNQGQKFGSIENPKNPTDTIPGLKKTMTTYPNLNK